MILCIFVCLSLSISFLLSFQFLNFPCTFFSCLFPFVFVFFFCLFFISYPISLFRGSVKKYFNLKLENHFSFMHNSPRRNSSHLSLSHYHLPPLSLSLSLYIYIYIYTLRFILSNDLSGTSPNLHCKNPLSFLVVSLSNS